MKRILMIFSCLSILFVLAGCGVDLESTSTIPKTNVPSTTGTGTVEPSNSTQTPHFHTWKEATCVTPKTCLECGATEGNVLEHTWDAGVVTKEATEDLDGEKLHTCTTCFATKTSVIPSLNHVHNYNNIVVIAPTCTAGGYTSHTCRCGDSYNSDEVAVLGHAWQNATCTQSEICSRCNATQGQAYGHSWKNATCTEPKTCTACQLTHGSALGHVEITDPAVAATCTTAGKTEGKHCSVCNAVLVAQKTVNAKGHTEVVDAAVAATCTTAGKTEGKHCSVCKEVLVAQKTVNAKGHTEVVDAAVAATCTTAGKTEGKHCSVCKEVLVAQKTVNAKGHTEVVDAAVAATCTTAGKTEGKRCSVCKVIIKKQENVQATGHTYVEGVCHCGDIDQNYSPNPQFVVSNVDAKAGDAIEITIALKNNPGIASIILSLAYNSDALTLTEVVYNNSIGGQTVQPQNMNSPVKLYWINGFADAKGDFVLVTLKFIVKSNAAIGDYDITLSYNVDDVYDISEKNLLFEIVNGKVTVKQ